MQDTLSSYVSEIERIVTQQVAYSISNHELALSLVVLYKNVLTLQILQASQTD